MFYQPSVQSARPITRQADPSAASTGADQPTEQFILVSSTKDYQNDASDEKGVPVQTALAAPMGSARVSSMMKGMGASRVLKTRLVDTFDIATSASSSVYVAANLYTRLTGLGEFTEFIGVFDEYKLCSVKATYIPFSPYKVEASVNPTGRSLVWAYDPNDSALPTSNAGLFANSTAKCFSNTKEKISSWNVVSSNPAVWYSTLSATNPLLPAGSLKIAGDPNLGLSNPVGIIYLEFEVWFRFRR